jgi:hypothetical protein
LWVNSFTCSQSDVGTIPWEIVVQDIDILATSPKKRKMNWLLIKHARRCWCLTCAGDVALVEKEKSWESSAQLGLSKFNLSGVIVSMCSFTSSSIFSGVWIQRHRSTLVIGQAN